LEASNRRAAPPASRQTRSTYVPNGTANHSAGASYALLSGATRGQENETCHPTIGEIYCAGLITMEKAPRRLILITEEGSDSQLSFQKNEYAYINTGSEAGVRLRDEFLVIRAVDNPSRSTAPLAEHPAAPRGDGVGRRRALARAGLHANHWRSHAAICKRGR
jgi:hypothetical protein